MYRTRYQKAGGISQSSLQESGAVKPSGYWPNSDVAMFRKRHVLEVVTMGEKKQGLPSTPSTQIEALRRPISRGRKGQISTMLLRLSVALLPNRQKIRPSKTATTSWNPVVASTTTVAGARGL